MKAEVPVLDRCPFFDHFQPKHLEKLTAVGTLVSFIKDEIVFHEDDEAPRFFVLLSGRVALECHSAGKPVLIDILHAGDELGWSAVLGQKKQFRARALEPVEASAFDAAGPSSGLRRQSVFRPRLPGKTRRCHRAAPAEHPPATRACPHGRPRVPPPKPVDREVVCRAALPPMPAEGSAAPGRYLRYHGSFSAPPGRNSWTVIIGSNWSTNYSEAHTCSCPRSAA